MQEYISGIQQVGIGVKNAAHCLKDYAQMFNMNALVFDDTSEASLMTRYTGNKVYTRQALLSLNMQGGGGFEIWQFKDRIPAEAPMPPRYGDLGIYAAKIKCSDLQQAHSNLSGRKSIQVSPLQTDEKGDVQFWLRDKQNNIFNLVNCNHWFQKNGFPSGGVNGAVIGVSDMEASLAFYRDVLNVAEVIYDKVTEFNNGIEDGTERYRKVLLRKEACGKGSFGKLLGCVQLELVQCLDRTPSKIYNGRFWGDCGFIHLCFDVFNMCGLKAHAARLGYKFTVDSIDSFDMEAASGRFCYMEDPDGTLIELVETHRVPVMKKLGIYLNLKKRNLEKPLPDWIIKLLALNKVK